MPAGRLVVGFVNLSIDIFLEVQHKRYNQILYLIYYIVYGLHLWYTNMFFAKICRNPISQHPGLGTIRDHANLSVKELKDLLTAAGVSYAGATEKDA